MALDRDEYWLKLAVVKGAGRHGRADKLWRVGKSEEVCYDTRKKLITRKRERERESERERALQGWEGVDLMTVVEWCASGAKDLRFIGRKLEMG